MDAASGSPSATRAIIVSEVMLMGVNNRRRQLSVFYQRRWTSETLCVFAVNSDDAGGMSWTEVQGAPLNEARVETGGMQLRSHISIA